MDRVFLGKKNIDLVFKYTAQGLYEKSGISLFQLSNKDDFKKGVQTIMVTTYKNTKRPNGIKPPDLLKLLNKTSIENSVKMLLFEFQRRQQLQQAPQQMQPQVPQQMQQQMQPQVPQQMQHQVPQVQQQVPQVQQMQPQMPQVLPQMQQMQPQMQQMQTQVPQQMQTQVPQQIQQMQTQVPRQLPQQMPQQMQTQQMQPQQAQANTEYFIEKELIGPPGNLDFQPEPTTIDDLDDESLDRISASNRDLGDMMARMQADRNDNVIPPDSNSIDFASQETQRNQELLNQKRKNTQVAPRQIAPRETHVVPKQITPRQPREMPREMQQEPREPQDNQLSMDDIHTALEGMFEESQSDENHSANTMPFPKANVSESQNIISEKKEIVYQTIDIDSESLVDKRYKLDTPLNKIKAVQVLSAEVPKSGYTVNKTNRWIHWREKSNEIKKESIQEGNYTIDQLIQAVETAMNKSGNGNYKIVLDPITEKVSVNSNGDSKNQIHMFELLFSNVNSVAGLLGFKNKDCTGNLNYTSDYRYNLEPPKYLNLCIPELSNSPILKLQFTNDTVVYFKSYLDQKEYKKELDCSDLHSLSIQWSMPNKKEYNFEGHSWSLSLCFYK